MEVGHWKTIVKSNIKTMSKWQQNPGEQKTQPTSQGQSDYYMPFFCGIQNLRLLMSLHISVKLQRKLVSRLEKG